MKRIHPSEHQIQATFIKNVRLHENKFPQLKLLFAVPNAAKRSMAIAAMMKAEGLRAGVPDIMFPWANNTHNGLAIEFKSHTGRLSDEQKDYLALLDQHHWKTCVLRDAEQAWIEVFNYLRNCK